jgi:hypothetical protein
VEAWGNPEQNLAYRIFEKLAILYKNLLFQFVVEISRGIRSHLAHKLLDIFYLIGLPYILLEFERK